MVKTKTKHMVEHLSDNQVPTGKPVLNEHTVKLGCLTSYWSL